MTTEYRILLVEDMLADAELARHELKRVLPKATTSLVDNETDYRQALEIFKPDLIISDFQMPGFDGLTALKIAIQITPITPVIILTGSMNEDTAVECMKAGAADYVIKEHIKRLGQAVMNALEKKKIRKEKEEASELLRRSEEMYHIMFANNPQPMLIYDSETLAILEVNATAVSVYGYTVEEFLSMTIKDIRPAEDIPDLLKVVDVPRENYNPAREWRHLKKNGELINVEIVSHGIYYHGRPARHVLIKDITDRKRAEEALKQSEERFRNLFENNLTVMLVIDPDTGRIMDSNKSAEKYYGWTHEQLMTMRIQDINILGDLVTPDLGKAKAHNQLRFEFRHRKADGSVRDVEVFASSITIQEKVLLHSVIHDITDRKKAEKQIRLLSRAIEQSPVSSVITDPDGIIEYVNPKFTEITGYTAKESIGKNPRILKSGIQSGDFYNALWKTISAGNNWSGEILNKKKNGELYWENMIISPMVDENNEIIHFISVKEDITEKKKLFEELIASKNKAEESDRLKTAFLHNISHEIRTPLNAIVGFSSILSNPDLPAEKRKDFVDIITVSNDQLLSIISGIIALATLEAGQEKINEKETDINLVLLNVYEQLLVGHIPEGVTFSFHPALPDEQALVYTDPVKLMQILVNLVENALKFTQKGKVRFGYDLQGNNLHFFVEDTGIGIPEGMHHIIFERFRQIDDSATRKYGGTGLGLALTKGYVELLGGTMGLTSEIGKGSIFSFTIPYNPVLDAGIAIRHDLKAPGRLDLPEKTILVAEDEDNNFLLICEILSTMNLKIIRAKNGLEAVNFCAGVALPDLVLMDIKMPVMDGIEATRIIKEKNPRLPVIALTAYALHEDKKRILASGCDAYLEKPLHPQSLVDKLAKYLAG